MKTWSTAFYTLGLVSWAVLVALVAVEEQVDLVTAALLLAEAGLSLFAGAAQTLLAWAEVIARAALSAP